MRIKWDIEKARKLFDENGYILDDEVYIKNTTKMTCHDIDGYKYFICVADLKTGRTPYKINKSNPYSIYNLNLCLKNRNSKSIVITNEYKGSSSPIEVKCECSNIFITTPRDILNDNKTYCNHCAKSKRYDGFRNYTQIITEKCKDLNYELLSTNITRSNESFNYICKKHKNKGIQSSSYDRFINRNQGCYYCGKERAGIKRRIPIETLKQLSNEKGFDFVDCDYPKRKTGFTKVKLHLICRKHKDKGIQYINYDSLKLNTSGCVYCNGYGRTKESLQQELNELNINIDVIEFIDYTNVTVKCRKCNNVWNTKGVQLTQGHGCSFCVQSNYAKKIEKALKDMNVFYKIEHRFDDCKDKILLPFDFFLPKYNIAIEVDGEQHFMPITFGGISKEEAMQNFILTQKHDQIKNEYCLKNNIQLFRIPYYDFKNDNFLITINKIKNIITDL